MSSPAWGVGSGHVRVAEQQAVAVVTLQRPEKPNALIAGMRRELGAILGHFGRGAAVRGIVLTGAGRAFSAGVAHAGINRFLSRPGAADE